MYMFSVHCARGAVCLYALFCLRCFAAVLPLCAPRIPFCVMRAAHT